MRVVMLGLIKQRRKWYPEKIQREQKRSLTQTPEPPEAWQPQPHPCQHTDAYNQEQKQLQTSCLLLVFITVKRETNPSSQTHRKGQQGLRGPKLLTLSSGTLRIYRHAVGTGSSVP